MKAAIQSISAKFLSGASSVDALKAPELYEIAIIGRSNAGKSTLLNRLTKNSRLSRVSATPGRTQEINLFEVSIKSGNAKPKRVILADLPGFGYAKLSHTKRQELVELIHTYLTTRRKLGLIILLNDCRRGPEADELEIQKIAFNRGARFMVAITKGDKLKQSGIKSACGEIAAAYRLESEDIILTGEKIPVETLWERIIAVIEQG